MGRSRQPAEKLTVAEILKRNAGQYVAAHAGQAVPQVQSTLAKLSLCRTAALGGHAWYCGGCQHKLMVHNSCGDRYCPTCSGARRSDWLESTSELILDGVDHFQVVFTLPSELSRIALGNRKPIYDLLFASAWSALKQTMHAEHGIDSAALMVLHTWNQRLDAHAHVHAVVPGCGPALDGAGIKFAQRDYDESSLGKYLVNADDLRAAYRKAFLRGLTKLHQQDKLTLTGEFSPLLEQANWQSFILELEQTDWVSFIQPPPQPGQSAEHVLKYLARYLSGGPISDLRILSTEDHSVTFLARAGQEPGGHSKQIPITLSQVEFTRRWCLHVLPSGYTRMRRFGGWSNPQRYEYLERLAIQLADDNTRLPESALEFSPWADNAEASTSDDPPEAPACPVCSAAMIPHRIIKKPSWSEVMCSPERPKWYLRN